MASSSTKEIKQYPDFEKYCVIYENMIEIGKHIAQAKGASQVSSTIKNMASELIPSGEELASAITDSTLILESFNEFSSEPPDITNEKELAWPVEPDLIY